MIRHKIWIVLFFTCFALIPVAFFAGAISFALLILAPVVAVLFVLRLRFRLVDFYLNKFDADELSTDLYEAVLTTAKIALQEHECRFQLRVFQNIEPQAFAIRGFKGERYMFLSSGLIRSVSENELRVVFRVLNERLENRMSSWVALYTMVYSWFLPKKPLLNESPLQFWGHALRVSFSRMILKKMPKFGDNASDSQVRRFGVASYGDLFFLSPLFLGPKVTQEYGSLESLLIRE